MKKLFLPVLLTALLFAACNPVEPGAEETVVLNLQESAFSYDETGVWTDIYNQEVKIVENKIFAFEHFAAYNEYEGYGYYSWSGFAPSTMTASELNPNSSVNLYNGGCCAKGGVAGEGKPYLVCFYNEWDGTPAVYFNDYQALTVKSVSLCQHPLAYNAIVNGDAYAHKFTTGDYFVVTIYAIGTDGKIDANKSIQYYLADFRDGKNFVNNKWQSVDLTSLGKVNGLAFTLETTDKSEFGNNTAMYFCLDALTVEVEVTK